MQSASQSVPAVSIPAVFFLLQNIFLLSFWKFSSGALNGERGEVRNELEFPETVPAYLRGQGAWRGKQQP